ncbi:MAG: DUF2325 domain-containing protein, partial [Thermodesulfobacteriota bacterium]|nr:DUF2325 domain-containing protein [Thermodesulfobacteriota bacterium]
MNQIDLTQVGNPFLPVEPVKAGYAENISQRRAWMIHSHFKCPVVGACLSLKEQKRLLKKMGISIKNRSAYEIHGIFVSSLSDKNRLSMRIDAYLHRKFKHEISKFSGLDRSLFLDAWKTHFQKGEIAGLLWVAATRTDLKEKDIDSIFGDIHMQMHLNAGHNIKLRQRLSSQGEVNLKLNKKFKESIQIRRTLKKENERLEREHAELRRQYAFLEKDKLAIEKELSNLTKNTRGLEFEDENQQLHDELANLTGEIWNYQQRQEALQSKNNKLLSKLESQSEINHLLKKETERIITQISALNRCDETCPFFDLCRKRILIVGGINRMESLYRQLIEKNGGIFEYHDGHIKGGKRALENRIRRADIVLCPVNINSHNACSVVKKMGKKHRKSVQMLAGSGLGTISQALLESQKGASIH